MPAPPSTMLPCLFDVGAASKIPPYASPPGACRVDQSGQIFPGRREGIERSPGRPSNVTQPALSRAIKLLEDDFGGALFHRERRQLSRWCARPCKKGSASGPRYPPPGSLAAPNNLPRVRSEDLRHIIRAQFFLIVEVTDRMTSVAILNCGARSVMP